MAQQALTAGMTVPRRRALFGLLDADGWGWASIKAAVWLVVLIMLLGYIPDRAYYFTVSRTVDFGVIVWSPINFCPPTNGTLPCPAPIGAIVPWETSPQRLALPEARTDGGVVQVSTRLFYIGGSDGTTAKSDVYFAITTGTGNFDAWAKGPSLPAPRADASVIYSAGKIFVIGGKDADGKPTSTVYSLKPNSTTGDLGEWTEETTLVLPDPRYGTAAAALADGILLVGGSDAGGPVTTTYKSKLNAQGALTKWEAQAPLKNPQSDGAAAAVGDYVWLFGGHDANGPVGAVQRGSLGLEAAAGLPDNPDQGKLVQWAITDSVNLPAARDDPAAWAITGVLYVAGGDDGTGPQKQLYWASPTSSGDIPEWKHLDVSDLPVGMTGGATVINGPDATIVGGQTSDAVLASSLRGNMAPQAPFFRLGLLGMTVPGLTINGEIGQQLGYLNAAGAGTLDFIILVIIGWAWAHKERSRAILARLFRRRS